ncbi:GNAT family N-acetyltransferase [Streptomyces sp. NPDC048483]|uniref:GNAT family N-acetyltransferase n=1 Tax=Streptomyces sp. NPDC048483 TaxID=3154927 RepID=UPI0034489E64
MSELRTDRLILRNWRESDLAPWAAMNADPEVRAYFPDVLTREQSEASVARFRTGIARRGWGWWAVEVLDTGEFIGVTGLGPVEDGAPFAGLDPADDKAPFTAVEAGWRLPRSAWGHGYATEAARAALSYGFEDLALPEILAVTAATNLRSQAVMRRLGMTHDPADDFDDPAYPEGPLRRSVVYRIPAERQRRRTGE